MTDSRRYGLAGLCSLLAHALFVFWGFWSLGVGLEAPEFEFEFETVELLDPDMLQGDDQTPEPPPLVGPPEPPPVGEDGAVDEPEPAPAEKKFGEARSEVDRLGPTNSTFYMLLATKKVAKLPFADAAAEIMAPLPDFQFIVQGGGFHPFRDFEYLVLASPDLRDLTQTFVAVTTRLPRSELKAGLSRAAATQGEVLEWELRDGLEMGNPRPRDPEKEDWDPRWFVLLDDKVGIYVREEFLPQILAGPDAKKGKTAGNFVADIAKMRTFTQQEPRAGMQIVMKDMRAALKRARGLPFEFPDDLEVMAEASSEPELVVKLGFLETEHARGAEKFWHDDLQQIIDGDLRIKFVVGGFYASTQAERLGNDLVLRNRFDSAQTRTLLELIADFSRKMMRKSKQEMDRDRAEREALWKARRGGKLLPSQALGKDEPAQPRPSPVAPGEPSEQPPADLQAPNAPERTLPVQTGGAAPDGPAPATPALGEATGSDEPD